VARTIASRFSASLYVGTNSHTRGCIDVDDTGEPAQTPPVAPSARKVR
jgi:hypothetical protein